SSRHAEAIMGEQVRTHPFDPDVYKPTGPLDFVAMPSKPCDIAQLTTNRHVWYEVRIVRRLNAIPQPGQMLELGQEAEAHVDDHWLIRTFGLEQVLQHPKQQRKVAHPEAVEYGPNPALATWGESVHQPRDEKRVIADIVMALASVRRPRELEAISVKHVKRGRP